MHNTYSTKHLSNMLPIDAVKTQSLLRTRGKGGAALTPWESFGRTQWDRCSSVIQTKHTVGFHRPHKLKNDVHQCTAMRGYCPFQVPREKTRAEEADYPQCHTPHVEAHSPSQSQSRIFGGALVGCHSHLPQRCSELSLQIVLASQNQWPVKEQLVIKNFDTNVLCQFNFAPKIVSFSLFLLDQLSLSDIFYPVLG